MRQLAKQQQNIVGVGSGATADSPWRLDIDQQARPPNASGGTRFTRAPAGTPSPVLFLVLPRLHPSSSTDDPRCDAVVVVCSRVRVARDVPRRGFGAQHNQMERDWLRQRGGGDGERPPPFNPMGGTAGPVRRWAGAAPAAASGPRGGLAARARVTRPPRPARRHPVRMRAALRRVGRVAEALIIEELRIRSALWPSSHPVLEHPGRPGPFSRCASSPGSSTTFPSSHPVLEHPHRRAYPPAELSRAPSILPSTADSSSRARAAGVDEARRGLGRRRGLATRRGRGRRGWGRRGRGRGGWGRRCRVPALAGQGPLAWGSPALSPSTPPCPCFASAGHTRPIRAPFTHAWASRNC